MDLNSLIKLVTTFTFDTSKQLQQYTEVQTGKGVFTQTKFEQIQGKIQQMSSASQSGQQSNPKSNNRVEQGQFYLDQPQQQPESSIKTYQFNSGMFAPTKIAEKIIQSSPNVQIQAEEFLGFNCKQKRSSVFIDQSCYCVSVGCNLILVPIKKQQIAKNYKMFQEHVFEICTLSYCPQNKILLSASKGIRPEIIAWSIKYEENKDRQFENLTLNFINKFRLPRKSEGVGFVKLICQNKIICIDSISMHRNNSIYFFDLQSGNHYKNSKKLQAKVYDFFFDQKTKLLLVTNKGMAQVKNIENNSDIQIISFYQAADQLSSITKIKDKIIVGDRKGSIRILTEQGKKINQKQAHGGWTFNLVGNEQNMLIISSGVDDNLVKIQKITQNKKQISLETLQKLQFSSYCTSIHYLNSQNILLSFRNGSIVVYDYKNKCKKYEKITQISCIEREDKDFFIYSRLSERVIYRIKNIIVQILPEKITSTSKNNYFLTDLKRQPKCIWIQKQKMIQLYSLKDQKFKFFIKNMTEIKGQPQKQGIIEIQNQGKPKIIRFNDEIVVIGTKQGYVIVYFLKKSVLIKSQEKHMSKVEDIIFQQGELKQKQAFYIKSVSKSQLFYWQIDSEQEKITKTTKSGPLKNLNWSSLCKYGWETRNIWEQMEHFDDIDSFAIIDRKYICAALSNGTLRIYRFPATRNNFIQFKLFPDKFKVLSSEKRPNLIICERNSEILLVKLKLTEN